MIGLIVSCVIGLYALCVVVIAIQSAWRFLSTPD